ncbi:hypothetical protein [Martelella endophytica]|uniref:Uncharacterized protein n=1 Tax=Martelella endophytica TaxID=1486262 RepID=A0A0D5LRV3_MAREN|nr:hypothetical protein [Martelella endophytica]AJY46497.1 hypothetical protein TM49_13715 [Martelella endophytica]
MTNSALPLFRSVENRETLRRLEERRVALLKRLQALPPRSHKRVGLTHELSIVTTELIRRETIQYPGGRHVR